MKKILIVDDSATSRAIFKASLPPGKYDVIEAKDLTTAMANAKAHNPDLCVMDYNLPDMNGTEIAAEIQKSGINPPFILMTANMQEGVVERAKKIGFIDFVEKPMNSEKLNAILGRLGWET